MRARLGLLFVLLLTLLAGCITSPRWQPPDAVPAAVGPISDDKVLLLYPFKTQLAVLDPATNQVERSIHLGRFAMAYAIAPNGKVYIPLADHPGDRQSYVAVLDRSTGALSKVPAPGGAFSMSMILPDGTAFISTGSTDGPDMMVVALDTHTDQVRGNIFLPGHAQRIAAYSDTEVLIPMTKTEGLGGNLYLVNNRLEVSEPLFPFDLEPFAPAQVIRKPGAPILYCLYAGFPPGDVGRRKDLLETLADPTLVESHIDIWDTQTHKLLKRIFLPIPSAQTMVMGPDGRLYVGHTDMTNSEEGLSQISVVSPEEGTAEALQTVRNPATVMIQGDRLYIASMRDTEMEIRHLPDLQPIARVKLPQIPFLPSLSF